MKNILTLILSLCLSVSFAQQQAVNIGSTPNDHSGDPLRTAFSKVNANDAELYANVLASATASGIDTYTAIPDPPITAYIAGQKFIIKFTNDNDGASTLSISGLSAKSLKKNVTDDLEDDDLRENSEHLLVYDGTNLQVLTLGGGGGGVWGDITGTLSDQTDLQTSLNLKANLAGPTFTGTVVLPSTTSIGTVSNTEIGYVDGVTSAIQTQIDGKSPTSGNGSLVTTGTLTSGATGAGFTIALTTSTVSGTLPAANLTPMYVFDRATTSTAGGTITLDMNNQIQRMHVGSASFTTPKTIVLSNAPYSLVFSFSFTVTDVAAVLTMPSDFVMSSDNWDGSDWTPPSTGNYEMGGSFDGTNWIVKIGGPFN